MKRLLVAAITLFGLAAGLACGGGRDEIEASGEITIVPDLTRRREGLTEQETLELFQAIMQRRAEFFDGSAEVTVNEDQTLTVMYKDIQTDIAHDLYFVPANFRIRAPQREGDMIICLTGPDQEVMVPRENLIYSQEGTRLIPRCRLDDGRPANIAWEEVETLNYGIIDNLDIASVSLVTEAGPTLIVALNEEGIEKLSYVSSTLINLPMGIFIDELIAGPKVAQPIDNGQVAVAGLSLREARIMRAQLRAGAVPAPYTVRLAE
ncbi:MAG TPA: hypothetical protein VMR52_08480 [Dehalococcoidia bacterium]|nr:hypothetical protein [Dehalococcoidia bacterium]